MWGHILNPHSGADLVTIPNNEQCKHSHCEQELREWVSDFLLRFIFTQTPFEVNRSCKCSTFVKIRPLLLRCPV